MIAATDGSFVAPWCVRGSAGAADHRTGGSVGGGEDPDLGGLHRCSWSSPGQGCGRGRVLVM